LRSCSAFWAVASVATEAELGPKKNHAAVAMSTTTPRLRMTNLRVELGDVSAFIMAAREGFDAQG
jgi:hypothetical protein